MDKLINKIITINEHTPKAVSNNILHIIIDENRLKYNLWQKKNDGTDTAAWLVFQHTAVGQRINIAYKELEKSFVNQQNKNITYTERTIFNIIADDIENIINVDDDLLASYPTPPAQESISEIIQGAKVQSNPVHQSIPVMESFTNTKDKQITRTAIAKSMLENCGVVDYIKAEEIIGWIYTGDIPAQETKSPIKIERMQEARTSAKINNEKEIRIEDVPF